MEVLALRHQITVVKRQRPSRNSAHGTGACGCPLRQANIAFWNATKKCQMAASCLPRRVLIGQKKGQKKCFTFF